MRYAIITTIVFLLLCSCQQVPQQPTLKNSTDSTFVDTAAVLNNAKNHLPIQTRSFSEIDSSGIILFPLLLDKTGKDGGRLSYNETQNNSYWNVLFYNSHTGAYHLLSERKMLIKNVDFKYSKDHSFDIALTNKYIFYQVTVTDYNNDGKLTKEDPEYLFVSDKAGHNFKQVSPDNYHLNSWQFIKSTNNVLMTLTKDSDADKKFSDKEEIVTFKINIDKDTTAREIFPAPFTNKLELLFDRHWK